MGGDGFSLHESRNRHTGRVFTSGDRVFTSGNRVFTLGPWKAIGFSLQGRRKNSAGRGLGEGNRDALTRQLTPKGSADIYIYIYIVVDLYLYLSLYLYYSLSISML